MGFLEPLGLLALLSLPLIAFLHLFRRRFLPLEVSALFLWQEEDRSLESGRRPERLKSTASLWLELLAAALLALMFAGPRGLWGNEAEHLVCVLDASASMGARDTRGVGTRALAVDALEARIGALSADSLVTVVVSGPRPSVLAGPGAFPAEAVKALQAYEPSMGRHDLEPAIQLGRELASEGSVLLLTDHPPLSGLPPEVELLSLGSPADNVAILHAGRTRSVKDGAVVDTLLLTLAALTRADVQRTLTLVADDTTLLVEQFSLQPDRRVHLTFALPAGTGTVVASLEGDALSIDDRVQLAPVWPRPIVLSTTLAAGEAEALGLTHSGDDSRISRWLALVPESREARNAGEAHLNLGRKRIEAPDTWNLELQGGTSAELDEWVGPFLAERHHALLEGVTLEGVIWSAHPNVELGGYPLVSVGDRPLLCETRGAEGRRLIQLNLEPARSTLQRSPDWPILLANLAELRRAELPGPVRTNVVLGEEFIYRRPGAGQLEIVALSANGTAPSPSRDGADLVLSDLAEPGLFAVLREGVELTRFGVNFSDAEESDLRQLASAQHPSEVALARANAKTTTLEALLLALAVIALLADWWVLSGARYRGRPSPSASLRQAPSAAR